MAAQHTRRALFSATLALPAILAAGPSLAGSTLKEDRWASLTRSAAFLDPTGPEVVAMARRLGFDPDDCAGIYKELTHGRRLLLVFEPFDAPGDFEPVHIDRHGIVQWGRS